MWHRVTQWGIFVISIELIEFPNCNSTISQFKCLIPIPIPHIVFNQIKSIYTSAWVIMLSPSSQVHPSQDSCEALSLLSDQLIQYGFCKDGCIEKGVQACFQCLL
jgi:hypothetical protein